MYTYMYMYFCVLWQMHIVYNIMMVEKLIVLVPVCECMCMPAYN
jgi:hypothetical protein